MTLDKSSTEQHRTHRVVFQRGYSAQIMAIDGTCRRNCTVNDVSEVGAMLTVEGTLDGIAPREFFLLLASTGLVYRRCELAWINGDQIGVNFLREGDPHPEPAALLSAR
jgi:hypothetical protein